MSVKKTREHRFTFQDASGKLRVVHVHLQHYREGEVDSVKVQLTHDGVKLAVDTYVEDVKVVKTKSRM